MARPSTSKIHAASCRCGRCDPAQPGLAQRFGDAMEPGDLDAIRFGLIGAAVAGIALLLLKLVPAVLAAIAAIGPGQ